MKVHPIDPAVERAGLVFAALCVLNSSFVAAVAKLTTAGAAPLFVAAATTAFGGLAAAGVLGLRGELHWLVSRDVGPRLAGVGLLGTTLAFLLFFEGAKRATAIDTVLCLQTEPLYSLVFAWVFLGHRPTRRRVAAAAVLALGILLAVGRGGDGRSEPFGLALLLVTPVCWQVSHLVVLRGLTGVAPPVLTGARYIVGGALLGLAWLASGAETGLADPAAELPRRLPLLALQGVVLSYAGTLVWYQAITRLDLARTTAIVVPSIPVLSIAVSFVLLGEVPSAQQWLGLALTASGVLAFVTAPHATDALERVPAPTAPIAVPAEPEGDA
jgi:drug/metabolite transporter (DMT)-like permease